ncbi:MAG: hypothetical protein OER97_06705 [Gammaproteobacteria bacterium]|nr:hypothetical protein [Gammaproteobacteria bacterium]
MNQPTFLRVFLVVVAAAIAGAPSCTDQQTSATGSADQMPKTESSKPMSDGEQGMEVDEQVLIARQKLAERLGVDLSAIMIDTVRQVHWSDGAVGCPKPGMMYTQAIVPGVLILLRADGEVHRYHAALGRPPSYCPADRAQAPALGQGEETM